MNFFITRLNLASLPVKIISPGFNSPIFNKYIDTPNSLNAFYTANSGFSRTLPHSFLTKEKQILALTFMKQIEK
ncbi:hypothetical protein FCU42_09530 [Vibrio parahaemolyticus]|nr:hypothetical protein [Vibrio parahaemolyticus]